MKEAKLAAALHGFEWQAEEPVKMERFAADRQFPFLPIANFHEFGRAP